MALEQCLRILPLQHSSEEQVFKVSIRALGINGWMLPLRTEHVDSTVKWAKANREIEIHSTLC